MKVSELKKILENKDLSDDVDVCIGIFPKYPKLNDTVCPIYDVYDWNFKDAKDPITKRIVKWLILKAHENSTKFTEI